MKFNATLLDDYRQYCGGNWGISSFVLDLILGCGLRRQHSLVEIGCGPLRIGKHLITFLDPECYTGIEPEGAMLAAGLRNELSEKLIELQRPRFLVECVGTSQLSADWCLAWDVFNHLSDRQFRAALASITADQWLLNVHVSSQELSFATDGEGWSYRFADTKAYVYTAEAFSALVAAYGYREHVVQMVETDWVGFPFAVMHLERCS